MNACSTRLVALSCLSIWVSAAVNAAVELPRVFGDHMVVQANAPLPVWGSATPGQRVVVNFAGQSSTTIADENGQWAVTLPELDHNATPQKLKINADNELVINDVLIGEVWVCAGQSNMEWPLKHARNAKEALPRAEVPFIRLLHLQGAARGGSGEYTAKQLSRLTPERFCHGSWQRCSPESAREFSAVGYYFGRALHDRLEVPIGLISPAIGGTPAEAWIRRQALAEDPHLAPLVEGNWLENPRLEPWCQRRAQSNLRRAREEGERIPSDDLGPNHSFKVGFMWEAGIKPLVPFAIRGVIWYQGESNAESAWRVAQHRSIFPRLVHDWRQQWGQGSFPFYFVQLPALGRPHWPQFREIQRQFLKQLPNVGMAIAIDVGHPANVHPAEKQPVGERLGRLALAGVYGQEIVASGPLLKAWSAVGTEATIEFEHEAKGLRTVDGQPPRGFQAAGKDGIFRTARARIVAAGNGSRDSIRLTCEDCGSIEALRYGWMPYPDPPLNLVNSERLPASPFTTEAIE